MKGLICTAPGALEYKSLPMPTLQSGHAILKIKRIGICGTDLHAYEGTQPYFSYPRILGHELAAELAEADGLSGFIPGELLTFLPYFSCRKCIACRNEKPNCCAAIQVCGVHVDGGMADYVSVPVDTLVKSEGLSHDELALVEPLAIGAHGIRRAGIMKDEFVLVVGAGPIGLGTMEFARIAGARVIAMDFNAKRLEFCRNTMSISYTINPSEEDAIKCLEEITKGDMPTVVIDATGNRKAINNGLQYLAHGGRYMLIGLQREAFCFSHPEFHKREATLMSSRNATRQDFEHVIRAIKTGLISPLHYITHRVRFDDVKEHFREWLDPSAGVIKAMIEKD